jgi:D-3-phosphoglycerate dehydrogenase / 2-oxoglutarate reductase
VSEATVVCGGPIAEPAAELLRRYGRIVVVDDDTEEGLLPHLERAVALVARGTTRVTRRVLDAAPRLRVIGRSGVGVDRVDLDAAAERGIPIVIAPGANADAVAEGTIALLLALVKRLPSLDRAVREGRWGDRDTLHPGDVAGTTFAVVGVGAVGRRVARLGGSLGMRVLAVDPALDHASPADGLVERASLARALAEADHISLHVPLTPETRGLLDARCLAGARRGLRVVNVSRGEVAPLDVLLDGLRSGILGGVALDVFDREPPDPSHPIFRRDDVICSPHAIALTPAATWAVFDAMSRGMAAVLDGGRAPHVANPSVHESEAAPGMSGEA